MSCVGFSGCVLIVSVFRVFCRFWGVSRGIGLFVAVNCAVFVVCVSVVRTVCGLVSGCSRCSVFVLSGVKV